MANIAVKAVLLPKPINPREIVLRTKNGVVLISFKSLERQKQYHDALLFLLFSETLSAKQGPWHWELRMIFFYSR